MDPWKKITDPFSPPIGYDGGIPAECNLWHSIDHGVPFVTVANKQE